MNGDTVRGPSQPIAALTYLLGFVTGIIFLYLEPYNQDEFVRFHARQSIGFSVVVIAVQVVFAVFIGIIHQVSSGLAGLLGLIEFLVNLGFAIFWLFLMYKAYSGERYRIPELSNVLDQVAGSNP
jgi:uncharacterized membrane protein